VFELYSSPDVKEEIIFAFENKAATIANTVETELAESSGIEQISVQIRISDNGLQPTFEPTATFADPTSEPSADPTFSPTGRETILGAAAFCDDNLLRRKVIDGEAIPKNAIVLLAMSHEPACDQPKARYEVLKVILAFGDRGSALIDFQNEFGRSPLMELVTLNDLDSVELLIQNGASTKITDRQNRTAVWFAERLGDETMLELVTTGSRPEPTEDDDKISPEVIVMCGTVGAGILGLICAIVKHFTSKRQEKHQEKQVEQNAKALTTAIAGLQGQNAQLAAAMMANHRKTRGLGNRRMSLPPVTSRRSLSVV